MGLFPEEEPSKYKLRELYIIADSNRGVKLFSRLF